MEQIFVLFCFKVWLPPYRDTKNVLILHNQNMMSICSDFSVLLKSVPCHLVANSLHSTFQTSFCLHLMWRKWLEICTGLIEFCYWLFEVCSHLLLVFVHGDEILVLQKKRKRKQLPILLLIIYSMLFPKFSKVIAGCVKQFLIWRKLEL